MATSPTPSESDRVAASAVYDLGAAVARFRYAAEVKYVRGENNNDLDAPVPEIIGASFRDVAGAAQDVAEAVPAAKAGTDALVEAAQMCRDLFERVWLKGEHLSRWEDAAVIGLTRSASVDWQILSGSPLGPPAWTKYQAVADRLPENLPGALGAVLRLSRLLAAVRYPLPSDYDPELDGIPASDGDHVVLKFRPRITAALREVRTAFGLLEGVDGRFEGRDPRASVIRLDDSVRQALVGDRGLDSSRHNSHPRSALEQPPDEVIAAIPAAPSAGATEASDGSDEDVAALLTLKKKLDPKDEYVGRSLSVLRLFRQLEDLNRRPKEPVVILGPSGSGKTAIARILHRTSSREGGRLKAARANVTGGDKDIARDNFKDLQANDLTGGDAGIVRDKWAGRGLNAGFGAGNEAVPGLLHEYAGGTIFVDELHDLDHSNQQFLRKVLDGRPIPLGAGRGPDIKPDVRLIFATYRDPDQLHSQKVLLHDFFRRLGGRYLVVPSLNDRKEDVPLFVDKLRDGRVPGSDFLFALLHHDWESGQVRELIRAIHTAAARKPVGAKLVAADLAGVLPSDLLERVRQTPANDVEREVLKQLVDILKRQGFYRRSRRAALHQRLAELLAVSAATVSRRLQAADLDSEEAGESPSP